MYRAMHQCGTGLRQTVVVLTLCYALALQSMLAAALVHAPAKDAGSVISVLCGPSHEAGADGTTGGTHDGGLHDLGCCLLCGRFDLTPPVGIDVFNIPLPAPGTTSTTAWRVVQDPRAASAAQPDRHPARGPPTRLA